MKTFEDFLMNKCPSHTNNSPEGFEKWLENRDIDEMMDYAEEYNKQSLTDYHNHIVEKVKNWFDSELENNKGDIKTYRNIHQDKEGILSLLQDTNPKE